MVKSNSSDNIKLSIISVNLNNSQGLETTLRSVIEQTYNNYELIIIDGASNDGSLEIIQKYNNNNSKWISEPDRGIYNAMNKGISLAQGEYCLFLNSGDWFVNNTVLNSVFSTNPCESILVGNIIMIRDKVVRIEKYPVISFGLFYSGSICHQAAFIKRDLFHKYGLYDENLKIVSDWKFFLETIILHNEPVNYIDIHIAYHDLYGISITQNELFERERETVLKEMFPARILKDYNNFWIDVFSLKSLKRYKLANFLFAFLVRGFNKLERIAATKEARILNKTYRNSFY